MVTDVTCRYEPSFRGLFVSLDVAKQSIIERYKTEKDPVVTSEPLSDLPAFAGTGERITVAYGDEFEGRRLTDEFDIELTPVHDTPKAQNCA
jgi:hypothetical protein